MIMKSSSSVAAAAGSVGAQCPPARPCPKLTADQRKTLTPFQIQVYERIMNIPSGKVTTYKSIATSINCKSCQAIGQALKRNPYNGSFPDVPCHRVIKTDLTVGGLSGSYLNADKKRIRLADEGVIFHEIDAGRWKVDPSCVQHELN